MAKPSSPDYSSGDYSPASTLIQFDRPIPLLRRPIRADPTPDPTLSPYVLAFPNPNSFFSALIFCESKLLEQCQTGVRIGCSIAASNKCAPPWWKTLFNGGTHKVDFRERNLCEEREMAICLDGSKDKCVNFAKEKCAGPFGSARVVWKEKNAGKLISCVLGLGFFEGNLGFESLFSDQLKLNLRCEMSIIRGSEILREGSSCKGIDSS